MGKQEKKIVFLTGIVLLFIFTFTDLQISMAVAVKPAAARILEILGEIPFTLLAALGCALLVRFRNRKSLPKNIAALLGGGVLMILLPDLIPALQGKEKMLRIFAYIWCITVGFSRVLMGAHFASDVTIGVMLSLLIFEILYTFLYRKGSGANRAEKFE